MKLKEFLNQNQNEFLEALSRVEKEKTKRNESLIVPEIFESNGEVENSISFPGTITIFIWNSKNQKLSTLNKVVKSNDRIKFNQIAEELTKDINTKEEFSSTINKIIDSKKVGDLYYKNKCIAPNLILPEDNNGNLSIGLFTIPFNGGKLDNNSFKLKTYDTNSSTNEEWEINLIKHNPKLTNIEIKALEDTENSDTLGIGFIQPEASLRMALAVTAFVVARSLGNNIRKGNRRLIENSLNEIRLTEERLNNLGNDASVEELITMRSQILKESFYDMM